MAPMTTPGTDRAHTDRIVWIDCEMTGLSLETDALVEVAALVTDYELTVLGDGVDVVIRPPDAALAQMGDFVRDMHTGSGLLDQLADGITLEAAQTRVLDYVREWVPEPRKAPLGGNTVATDRAFLARDMAELEAHLHYRIIDVSSIKELSRRWFPAPTSRPRPRPAATARSPTSASRSPSCATTARRCSCRRPAPPPNRPAPWPPATSSTTTLPRSVPPWPPARVGAWSGAPPSNGYDGSRCGRNGILGCRAPAVVGIAQLVEHLVVVQVAAGSSPVTHPT